MLQSRHLRAARRGERGAELIEFAIAFPLLFLLVAAIVDFGFMFRAYEVVTNAAREGARLSILTGYTTPDVQSRVAIYISAAGLKQTPTIVVNTGAITLASGAKITARQVVVSYPYSFPFIGSAAKFFNASWGSITLKAGVAMRQETPAS